MCASRDCGRPPQNDQAVSAAAPADRPYSLMKLTFVPVVLGLVLLAAGGLKAHEVVVEPAVGETFWGSRWFLAGLVEFELLLGMWLISGWQASQARKVALATFSVFLVVAVYRAANGASSCACFGRLEVSSRFAVVLDIGALVAISVWIPGPRDTTTKGARAKAVLSLILLLILLLAGAPLVILSRQDKAAPLQPSSSVIDMGEMLASGTGEVQFTLQNRGTVATEVSRIEASCSCLTVRVPGRIEPDSVEVMVQARLDLAGEPDFIGDLVITVRGLTADGEVAFAVLIKVRVR